MCVLCVNVFPPCLQVCVVPKFLSLDFEMPPETLVFLKTGIKVQFNALAAGRRPKFDPKNRDFHWGARFILVLRQLDVLGSFSGLLCICEASKKWPRWILVSKRLKYVSMGECFLIWALYFLHFHVGARFQKFNSFSRIFWANVLFAIYVCTCILMFFEGRLRRMKKMWRKMGTNQHSTLAFKALF